MQQCLYDLRTEKEKSIPPAKEGTEEGNGEGVGGAQGTKIPNEGAFSYVVATSRRAYANMAQQNPPTEQQNQATCNSNSLSEPFMMSVDLGNMVEAYTRAFSKLAIIIYNMGRPISKDSLQKWEQLVLVPRGGSIRGVWYLGKGYSFVLLDSRDTRDSILK